MKNKLHIAYWATTIIFVLWLMGDGISGLMQVDSGKQALAMLGYPMYLLTINGGAKVIAAIVIIQSKYRLLKEWAYAGYAVNCVGASASWWFATGEIFGVVFPIIFLAFMFLNYYLWKKTLVSK